MKFSFSKAIPLTAGSITIVNFLLSIFPSISAPLNRPESWVSSLDPSLKFIFTVFLTLISSFVMVKLMVILDRLDTEPSSKMTMIAILAAAFAWLVIFNIKMVALNHDLEGIRFYIFLGSSWIFQLFATLKLEADLKRLGYKSREGVMETGRRFSPLYIVLIRFAAFWFVIILGGIYYVPQV